MPGRIVRSFASYSEVSPSGTGIKIFVRGKLPGRSRRSAKKHGKRGIDRATKALCRTRVNDPLNDAWNDGDFEEFRASLRVYVQTGLRAARGEKTDAMRMEAVG